jgi:hypothetical protein
MNSLDPTQLSDVLAELRQQSFYGSLEIKLEAGEVVLLKKTETIKPHCRDNRGQNVAARNK